WIVGENLSVDGLKHLHVHPIVHVHTLGAAGVWELLVPRVVTEVLATTTHVQSGMDPRSLDVPPENLSQLERVEMAIAPCGRKRKHRGQHIAPRARHVEPDAGPNCDPAT